MIYGNNGMVAMRNTNNKLINKAEILKFEAEFSACIEPLVQFFSKYVNNAADVDGIVQDTLEAGIKSYPGFKGDCPTLAWLKCIAKRKLARYYQRNSNAANFIVFDETAEINNTILNDECFQATSAQELLDIILELPKKYQKLLHWHAVDGLSHAEIGKKLDISENAVNLCISRARAALRKKIQK